jgi:hypothetical protein
MTRDPRTPTEWQEAVDSAHVLLLIRSAEAYGLISHTLDIDDARCEDILRRGTALGVTPQPDTVERMLRRYPKEPGDLR